MSLWYVDIFKGSNVQQSYRGRNPFWNRQRPISTLRVTEKKKRSKPKAAMSHVTFSNVKTFYHLLSLPLSWNENDKNWNRYRKLQNLYKITPGMYSASQIDDIHQCKKIWSFIHFSSFLSALRPHLCLHLIFLLLCSKRFYIFLIVLIALSGTFLSQPE